MLDCHLNRQKHVVYSFNLEQLSPLQPNFIRMNLETMHNISQHCILEGQTIM